MWICLFCSVLNPFLHTSQWKGRIPVWSIVCSLSCTLRVNALLQPACVHLNGFTPVCSRVCRVRSHDRANAFLQPANLHLCGLSRLCVMRWFDKLARFRNVFGH